MHAAPLYTDEFHDHASHDVARILLALTDDAHRTELQRALERKGYDVETFKTGAELMQHLHNSVAHEPRPDLVICATALDGVEGSQVCRLCKAAGSLVPFIVLTSSDEAREAEELSDQASVLPASVNFERLLFEVLRLAGAP